MFCFPCDATFFYRQNLKHHHHHHHRLNASLTAKHAHLDFALVAFSPIKSYNVAGCQRSTYNCSSISSSSRSSRSLVINVHLFFSSFSQNRNVTTIETVNSARFLLEITFFYSLFIQFVCVQMMIVDKKNTNKNDDVRNYNV